MTTAPVPLEPALGISESAGWMALRRWYRRVFWGAFAALLLLLLSGITDGKFTAHHAQFVFCALGIIVALVLAYACHPADRPVTLMGRAALLCVALSQVFYQLLVWSEPWRLHRTNLGWRLWGSLLVAALFMSLLQVLWRAGARWDSKRGMITLVGTGTLGALLIGLMCREQLMAPVPLWWQVLAWGTALCTLSGSLGIVAGWLKDRPSQVRRWPRWASLVLYAALGVLLLGGGFYVGRISVPPPNPFDLFPAAIIAMPHDQLERQTREDLDRLKIHAAELDALREEAQSLHADIVAEMKVAQREIYTPRQDDAIRWCFVRYLAHRDALTSMLAMYAGHKAVTDERLRARAFLLGLCASATALETGYGFVARYRDDTRARAKLNEAAPVWGVEAGMFDQVYYSVTSGEHLRWFERLAQEFERPDRRAALRATRAFTPEDLKWLEQRIDTAVGGVRRTELNPWRARFSRIVRRAQQDVYTPMYEAQTLVASLVGDTRISTREPHIALAQLEELRTQLQPGDIILERRNWYLSNAFLPGFWPHAALYVGTPEQLRELGVDNATEVRAKWEAYMTPDHGHPRLIVEAVSEGVVFSTLEHSLHADYVAVLRPRLKREQIAQALRRAFTHHGKPYDFNFDFGTDDKVVCTELVYRSYGGLLEFPLEKILGKDTLTALGIARKFAGERGRPDAALDFVLFLDTPKGKSQAVFSTAEQFIESITRPKAFNE
ncbi:MAG: hypothetical protein EXS22_06835 [Pedosphaera sp.]|nr:hypothetical protein [Pedosphaera sp.]